MSAKYIFIEAGGPSTADTLPIFPTTRLAVIHKFWEKCEAYDPQGRYRMVVPAPPVFTSLQIFLAKLFYNPMENITIQWERIGDYDPSALIQTVRRGLETDDDIIQQWFEGSEVIKLLESAQSYAQMLLAVRAICGEHETEPDVLTYVEQILGKQK